MTLLKLNSRRSDVIYRQGKKIHLSTSEKIVNCEIDGDPGPSLPIDIEVIAHAVNVLVPPDAKPAGIRTRIIRMMSPKNADLFCLNLRNP